MSAIAWPATLQQLQSRAITQEPPLLFNPWDVALERPPIANLSRPSLFAPQHKYTCTCTKALTTRRCSSGCAISSVQIHGINTGTVDGIRMFTLLDEWLPRLPEKLSDFRGLPPVPSWETRLSSSVLVVLTAWGLLCARLESTVSTSLRTGRTNPGDWRLIKLAENGQLGPMCLHGQSCPFVNRSGLQAFPSSVSPLRMHHC